MKLEDFSFLEEITFEDWKEDRIPVPPAYYPNERYVPHHNFPVNHLKSLLKAASSIHRKGRYEWFRYWAKEGDYYFDKNNPDKANPYYPPLLKQHYLRSEKKISYSQEGRSICYRTEDVEQFMDERRIEAQRDV